MVQEHEETGLTRYDGEEQQVELVVDAGAIEMQTRVDVDIQVATAKRYPRNVKASLDSAEALATMDEATAESMFFAMKRGGKVIDGPSIRMAEVFFTCWGNLRCDAKLVDVGEKDVTAVGFAWDVQTNAAVRMESKRRIVDKNGNRYNDDMILTTAKAAISVALRDAIFRIVPRPYVMKVFAQCKKIVAGDVVDLATRRAKAFQAFAKWGVSVEQICAALEVATENDITPDHLVTLVGFRNAIRDGQTTIEKTFPPIKVADVEAAPQMQDIVNKLQNATAKPQSKADDVDDDPHAHEADETNARDDLGGRGPTDQPPARAAYTDDDRANMYEKVCVLMASVGSKKMDKVLKDAGIETLNEKTPAIKLATVLDKLGAKVK